MRRWGGGAGEPADTNESKYNGPMLTAYFDDSGTHAQSPVVCWAGLFGDDAQWVALDIAWSQRLKESVPGKDPIKRFHMADCENRSGEFRRWNRLECDFLAYELAKIIVEHELDGYAIGISQDSWEAEVAGVRRKLFGDAEAFCVIQCLLWAERWSAMRAGRDEQLALVFDRRPHRSKKMQFMFDLFKAENKRLKLNLLAPQTPLLSTLDFKISAKCTALQAADLFAWEYFQNAKDVILRGAEDFPRRRALQTLVKSQRYIAQIGTPDTIKGIAEREKHKDADYVERLKRAPKDWPF